MVEVLKKKNLIYNIFVYNFPIYLLSSSNKKNLIEFGCAEYFRLRIVPKLKKCLIDLFIIK